MIERHKMNPTEKGSTNHESQVTNHDPEPAWIRDTDAGDITIGTNDLSVLPQTMAAICEGEKYFCERCGAEFALWPTRGWADHLLVDHAGDLTIMSRTGASIMCQSDLPPAQQTFFSMMFSFRVSMRRRAWKLGHAKVVGGKTLVDLSN
jgi:hypothetical protein